MSSSAVDLSDSSGSDEQQNQSHSESQHQPSANGNFQPGIVMPSTVHIVPHSQLEAGHIMAPVAYPYIDPYYGGIIAAYSGPSMMHPHLMGIVQAGVPLPTDAVEEPVYVNAKQYHGILRRRQSRAKAESVNKLIKSRKGILMEILFCPAVCPVFLASSQKRHHGGPHKFDSLASNLYMRHLEGNAITSAPYIHESRHLHAIKRARGSGGRFLNSKQKDEQEDEASSQENVQPCDGASSQNPASVENVIQLQAKTGGPPATTTTVS